MQILCTYRGEKFTVKCIKGREGAALLCTLVFMGWAAERRWRREGGLPQIHAGRRCVPHGNTQSCHLPPRARARIRGNILIKPSSFPRGSSSLSLLSTAIITAYISVISGLSAQCTSSGKPHETNWGRGEAEDGRKSDVRAWNINLINMLVENKEPTLAQEAEGKQSSGKWSSCVCINHHRENMWFRTSRVS